MSKSTSQPQPQQRYQDASGRIVTVRSVQFNRVTLLRQGYQSPCTYSLERFIREFMEVSE